MTLGRARAILSYLWVAASMPLLVIIIFQSILGKFGKDWDLTWSWLSPLIFPALFLVMSMWRVEGTSRDQEPVRSKHVFWLTVGISCTYLISVYAVVLLQPFSVLNLETLLRYSSLYLGLVQGLATGALGKFFLENA